MSDNRLVYSTEQGRIKPQANAVATAKGDGIVRIHRETKGRKGKGASIIRGLPLTETELKALCKELKKKCACGGSVKDASIEIQGDVRDKLKALLEQKGYQVKLAGG
ncbi:stress response translation initiation inhibitor YciH [Alteromonas sp. ASW11-36]|uniref:Stress response translation initiation inhibitor YciH n=1 Tax=Alteromonas arenosi TaxID=3055817 RepID=A0ABT7SUX3_9ALTE|nr:stress response translation initiation inhibitor YciH [Alteromonas sp. ASW11-36]MDM7859965.1 stress response translation initiation inhibitor YciH [Alteromonas sp. ASW11-36]